MSCASCLSTSPLKPLSSREQRHPLSGPAGSCAGRWQQTPCSAGDGAVCAGGAMVCPSRDPGRGCMVPFMTLPKIHFSTLLLTRSPATGEFWGWWGEASSYLFSLCANTRALLEPPCDAASREAAKAGRLPSFCLLPSRCGWPCQADGSAPGRDERRRQEQLAPSVPGPRAEMLSSVGSSGQADEAVTSPARLRLCRHLCALALPGRCCQLLLLPAGTLRWGLGEVLAATSSAPDETGVSWGQPQSPALMQEPPGHVFSEETWMSVSQRSLSLHPGEAGTQ